MRHHSDSELCHQLLADLRICLERLQDFDETLEWALQEFSGPNDQRRAPLWLQRSAEELAGASESNHTTLKRIAARNYCRIGPDGESREYFSPMPPRQEADPTVLPESPIGATEVESASRSIPEAPSLVEPIGF